MSQTEVPIARHRSPEILCRKYRRPMRVSEPPAMPAACRRRPAQGFISRSVRVRRALVLTWTLLLFTLPAAARFATPFRFAPPPNPLHAAPSPVSGALKLSATAPDGLPLHGLSGLQWSARGRRLYALSDFGYVVVLRPSFERNVLTDVEFMARIPLQDDTGAPLQGRARDAEGLALQRMTDGRETLLVSFEHVPRVCRFDLDGSLIETLPLPPRLSAQLRLTAPNRGLEGLAWSPSRGALASLESPVSLSSNQVEIHALREAGHWTFPAAEPGGALVSLDMATDDAVMLLERRYQPPRSPLVITLRLLELDPRAHVPRTLARFSSAEGWPVDNFEAVARHRASRYFILSDDNANALQSTLLVYLSFPDLARPRATSRAVAASARRDCRGACDSRVGGR